MQKLLLLEDDISLVDGLEYSLRRNGFEIEVTRTVKEARETLGSGKKYDLLLLDVTLPDGSGFEICEGLRQTGNQIPIIFLTASDEEPNIIRGLDGGADDYITKPFKLGELCSRIRALLRRSGMRRNEGNGYLVSGALEMNLLQSKVSLNGRTLDLTGAEYHLLRILVENRGQTLTRSQLLDWLWDGNGHYVDDNTLSVYVRRLREKIEKYPSHPEHLLTVRGFGYQWKE
ncbi:MAG: response regulator transcription factor [Lachnospiraceae bacterium]|nr:response regulator transcription factor [Lachnospiraceae bacterium]